MYYKNLDVHVIINSSTVWYFHLDRDISFQLRIKL